MSDFLIVGGGIGGAVLANLLGRRGKRVLVLEKGHAPAPQERPEILWPATAAVLRGLIPEHLEPRWALPVRGGAVLYRGRELLRFGPDVFAEAGVQPYSTANTRELLMRQAPCDYRRGVEVTRVLRERGRVVGVRARDTAGGVERDYLAGWTVGDDGARSVVRRGCGLPMALVRFPIDLLGFRFDWPARLPSDEVRVWFNEDRVRSGVLGMPAAPMPEGKGAALLPVWPELFLHERRLRVALRAFFDRDPLLAEIVNGRTYPQGMTRFRLAWGRNPCFGSAGALLLGDAAHPVTPAGGQGANSAVADALAVAELADAPPAQLLAEYRRRRLAAVRRSLAISRAANHLFGLPRPLVQLFLAAVPWAARRLNGRPWLFGRFLRTAAEAFQDRRRRG